MGVTSTLTLSAPRGFWGVAASISIYILLIRLYVIYPSISTMYLSIYPKSLFDLLFNADKYISQGSSNLPTQYTFL